MGSFDQMSISWKWNFNDGLWNIKNINTLFFITKILTSFNQSSVCVWSVHPCETKLTFRRCSKQLSTCYIHNSITVIWFWSHEPRFSSSHYGSPQINMAFDCISWKNTHAGSLHCPAKQKLLDRLLHPSTSFYCFNVSFTEHLAYHYFLVLIRLSCLCRFPHALCNVCMWNLFDEKL